MLLGMASWRCGLLREPARHHRLLLGIAVTAGLVDSIATALNVFSQASGHDLVAGLPRRLVEAASYTPLGLAYVAVLLLCINSVQRGKLLSSVAALGQMALTNYISQSVVLSLIFHGYGAGLCGRLAPAAALVLGLLIYAVQLVASRLWLRRYRFGPLEWVWRSLTYGKRQPMLRLNQIPQGAT